MFGAYDLHEDRLRVRLRQRRRGSDNLAFMTQIRGAIPARRRIYWIHQDLPAHGHDHPQDADALAPADHDQAPDADSALDGQEVQGQALDGPHASPRAQGCPAAAWVRLPAPVALGIRDA